MAAKLLEIPASRSRPQLKHILHVSSKLAKSATPGPEDAEIAKSLSPLLKSLLRRSKVPFGPAATTHKPPAVVPASFSLVRKHVQLSQTNEAFSLFRVLVDTGNVPPEAIHQVDPTSSNFQSIMYATLIRSALHWDWRQLAATFLQDIISDSTPPSGVLFTNLVDCIYVLLETANRNNLDMCRSLICDLHLRAASSQIPSGLIRRFYDSASLLDAGDEAEKLYAYSQSPAAVDSQFPTPQGRALSWLLRHLTLGSQNMHLGRVLAKHVVDKLEPIPVHDRASFIAITAANGYASQARALWERYSVGRDRVAVVGNSSMTVRLVGLFTSLIKRLENKLHSQKAIYSEAGVADREANEARLADMRSFVNRVAADYRKCKEPLGSANHYDLNSLARISFMLGDYPGGFNAFKVLIDRKEIPDLHDVNVALSAMAEHSPRTAARTIEKMVERNLKPDAVTFGTVIHHAILRGDMELVEEMIEKARHYAHQGKLTLKSVSALVKASVSNDENSLLDVRANLTRALEIIRALADSSFVCTPNTGKHCILAARRVDDPLLAFEFWKLLVKDKAEWEDRQHRAQRRMIARMFWRHQRMGWIGSDKSRRMLAQLQEVNV